MNLNKRLLDLLAGISAVLTFVAATPDNKEVFSVIPVAWQPYVIKAGIVAALVLKVLAFFAPPTPSLTPAQAEMQKAAIDAAKKS